MNYLRFSCQADMARILRCGLLLWAGGSLLAATGARGAIHYYYGDIDGNLGFEQPLDLNFENDDFDDVVLDNYVSKGAIYQGLTIPYSPGRLVGFIDSGQHYIKALSAGDRIDSTTLGPSYYGTLAFGAESPASQFNDVHDRFVGLAFPAGAASLQYAWMRVTVDNAAGVLHVRDWAFEDVAGVGIIAGDTGTLPMYGDINGDRLVDGADLLTWQRGFPAIYNVFDLRKWKDNFGAGATAVMGAASIAVPEPATYGLLALGGLWAAVRRRQRSASPADGLPPGP